VRDPRPTKISRALLDGPRTPANRDLLAIERRRLWWRGREQKMEDYPFYSHAQARSVSDDSPINLAPKSKETQHPEQASSHSATTMAKPATNDGDGSLTLLIYRYTKHVDLVNDEMGYGERIIEPYFMPKAPGTAPELQLIIRVSQRTKTGRQELFFADATFEHYER
jgi:hypothetical protein